MPVRPRRKLKSSQKRSSQHLKNRRARVRTSRVEMLEDRRMLATDLVSIGDPLFPGGNDDSSQPSISGDGRYVTYHSYASNLVAGDTNSVRDVFVLDRNTNTTTRVSVDSAGTQANGHSFSPSISGDGRYVTFQSDASNLVSGDSNSVRDVFVLDRSTNTTTRVSVDSSGNQGDLNSTASSISSDGRYVT
ncbi:MAG: TolB family protein [Pirellulales bacterium]